MSPRNSHVQRWLAIWVIIVAIGFTPYYSLALLGAAAAGAYLNPFRAKFFETFVARFVTSFLLLCSIIMAVAMYCWFAKLAVQPVYVLLPFAALWFLINRRILPSKAGPLRLLNKEDVLAICLASVSIVVILVSFYLPKPTLADSIQLITNGYDNGAHYLMIETAYDARGYVYGSYSTVKSQVISASLIGYPQGWHFVNAFFWRGTGAKVFGGRDAGLAYNLYVASLFVWQFLALYLFAKASALAVRFLGVYGRLFKPGPLAAFCSANLLLQLLVFWGAFNFGFAPFIAALTYLSLLAIFVMSLPEERSRHTLAYMYFSLLCTVGIGLSWLLPAPAALLTIVLCFAPFIPKQPWKLVRQHAKLSFAIATGIVLLGVPLLAQALINKLSPTEGASLINENGGIFGVSDSLALIILFFSAITLLTHRSNESADKQLTASFMAITSPVVLLTGAIFVYQIFSAGQTAYFFTKTLALALVLAGIFFVAAFTKYISAVQFSVLPSVYASILAVTGITALVFATGQTTLSFNTLFQRYSNVPYNTAQELAVLAHNGTLRQDQVAVFRNASWNEDVIASVLANYTTHRVNQCMSDADWVIITKRPAQFSYFASRCAKSNHPLTVIASPESVPLLPRHNPNIHIIVTD